MSQFDKYASQFTNAQSILNSDYMFIWRPGMVEPLKIQVDKINFNTDSFGQYNTPNDFPNAGDPKRLYIAITATIEGQQVNNVPYVWNVATGTYQIANQTNLTYAKLIEILGFTPLDAAEKGANDGVAPLVNGTIPSAYILGVVNEVVEGEYINDTTFYDVNGNPVTPSKSVIYNDTFNTPSKQYRWGGSKFVETITSPGSTDALAEGTTNLYFTDVRVRNTVLTGIVFLDTSAITASDNVLSAFGKLQAQVTDIYSKLSDRLSRGTFVGTADDLLQQSKDYAENLVNGSGASKIYSSFIQHLGGFGFRIGMHYGILGEVFGTSNSLIINDITLDAPPTTTNYKRVDVVAGDINGNIVVVKGPEGETGVKPNVDPNTQIELTFFTLEQGATEPTNISSELVYDDGGVNNWTISENTSGARVNANSSNTPIDGTVSIEFSDGDQYDAVRFTPQIPVPRNEISAITYSILNKIALNKTTHRIILHGTNGNGGEAHEFLDLPETYGYDPLNVNDVQEITIPPQQNSPLNSVTYFRIVNYTKSNEDWGSFIDLVKLTKGVTYNLSGYVTKDAFNSKNAEQDGRIYALETSSGGGGSYTPPSPYATMQAMYDDQANQVANQTYRVTDASGHSEVELGRAWFEYLGTTSQDKEEDYILKGEEESLNLDQQFDALQQQITANANNITSHNTRLNALEGIKPPITKAANFFITAVTDGEGKNQHLNKIFCTNASAITATIPNDATENIAAGFETTVFWTGAGGVSFAIEANVTLNIDATELAEIFSQYNAATLIKRAANTWIIVGALKKA